MTEIVCPISECVSNVGAICDRDKTYLQIDGKHYCIECLDFKRRKGSI